MKLLEKNKNEYKKLQWEKQNKICPLCGEEIPWDEAVLDHDHDKGHCRQVLHNNCNVAEGKLKRAFIRYVSGKGIPLNEFIVRLASYLNTDYSENPIHPSEKSPLEKELSEINKKLKKLKRESVIEEYRERAREIRKILKEERASNSWKPE